VNVLLDTNVLSEVRRPAPDLNVLKWLDTLDEDRAFLSVVTIAELRRGIALMDTGQRRDALAAWISHDLPNRFEGRTIPIDTPIAERWGDLMSEARRRGVALSVMDGFLAATALVRGLVVATRNTKDFLPVGVQVLNPWIAEGP
jgi:predicted nucleic acid-binding protein